MSPWVMTGIWIVAVIAFLTAEVATMTVISAYFCLGALAGLLTALCGTSWMTQVLVFLAVSLVALFATRPIAQRYLKPTLVHTNADRVLGMEAAVTEEIDNAARTGAIYVLGLTWTARSDCGEDVIPVGTKVRVERIDGIKLMCRPVETAEPAASVPTA
ncbi:MAG: NfeD family protein [Clostridia bacterium]|nr:NfeD family protein [Clostridia bacterium]